MLIALVCLLCCAPLALGGEVVIPLSVRLSLLNQLLEKRLYAGSDQPRVLYQEGSCRFFSTSQPHLEIQGRKLRFISHGSARLGISLWGHCLGGLDWTGTVALDLLPSLDEAWQLRFRVSEVRVFDAQGHPQGLFGFVLRMTTRFLQPLVESFTLDLAPPRQELAALVRATAPLAVSAQVETILASLKPQPPYASAEGIAVPLAFTVPDLIANPPAPVKSPEAPLTPQELEHVQQALQPWDAFLVFVIKSAGLDISDGGIRGELFQLLIASRYRLLPILGGELPAGARDPVRVLFKDAWERLRAIIQEAERRGLVQDHLLQYLTFINAGDALLALQSAAPGLGIEMSTDGLRRLARALRPAMTGDPLQYSWEVDPELRELFGFGPDQQLPLNEPPASDRLGTLLVRSARADAALNSDAASLGKRLDGWIPTDSQLDEYRRTVHELLDLVVSGELQRTQLGSRFVPAYRNLVPSTALIESCWRHFVRQGGRISYLRSDMGGIGLMQINRHVWRGFYNVERLKWNVAYNALAGGQILMRYLQDYGAKVVDRTGDLDAAPRATYSVYNAGPGAARRFMSDRASARERRVDNRLWTLYQGIAAGGTVNLASCTVDPPAP